jgi:VCBS repeat protein/flagellar hook capping protein FlgD
MMATRHLTCAGPIGPGVPRASSRAMSRAALACGGALLFVLSTALGPTPARAQQFTEINTGLAAPPNPCAAWGDYDGDGDLDLLVAGLGRHDVAFSTLYTNSGGTFTDSGVILLGLARASAAWGDFDGDGDLDLAMTGLTSAGVPTTRIYRNDGGTTFTALPGSPLGVLAGSVAWGDYDGDGDLDLLITGVTSTVPNVGVAATRLYRNDGGTFVSVPHPFPNCFLGAVAWGDYDRDGRPDLLIAGTSENNALFADVWHNDGGGLFTAAGAGLPGTDLGPAAWGDYDNDGDLDLLFGGNSNDGFITRIYRNDGGTFVDANAGLLGLLWASGGWGDFDNDGDLDVMVSGYDAVAQVARSILYRNDAGTFTDSGLPFHNLYLGLLSWADYDNDGDIDLLIAGNEVGADLMVLYRNNDATSNIAPGAPANLAADFLGADVKLSWSAAADDHTPSGGLSYNLRAGTTPGGTQVVSPHSAAGGGRRLPDLGNAQADLAVRLGGLLPGVTYYWSVQAVDGAFIGSAFAPEASFTFAVTGVGDAAAPPVAVHATPNPFARSTTLEVAGVATARARFLIYDTAGRLVRRLGESEADRDARAVTWDGRDQSGRELPAGVYRFRLEDRGARLQGTLVKLR